MSTIVNKKIKWDIPFLEELYAKDMPMKDRWQAYISCHPEQMTFGTFKARVSKLGFRSREYIPFYTEEQKEFLRNTYTYNGVDDTTRMFNEKFGTDKTTQAIKAACFKMGIKVDYEIKRRDRIRVNKDNYHEVGDIVMLQRDGKPYPIVVTGREYSPGVRGTHYQQKTLARHVYEKAYGELPKNMKVVPLDGDLSNVELSNLHAVPVHYVSQLSHWNKWYGKGELTEAAIKYLDLTTAISKANKRLNEGV